MSFCIRHASGSGLRTSMLYKIMFNGDSVMSRVMPSGLKAVITRNASGLLSGMEQRQKSIYTPQSFPHSPRLAPRSAPSPQGGRPRQCRGDKSRSGQQDPQSPRHEVEIVKGKRAVTVDTALRVERYFGWPAEVWLNRQTHNDQQVTKESSQRALPGAPPRPVAGH